MSEEILFHAKKHGRYTREGPKWGSASGKGTIKSEIILTREKLTIRPKEETLDPIIIPIDQIEMIMKNRKKIHFWMKIFPFYTEILLKDGSRIFIIFFGSSGWKKKKTEDFFDMLKMQVERIEKEKIEEKFKKFGVIKDPIEILKVRLAKGEISEEEFIRKKKLIQS